MLWGIKLIGKCIIDKQSNNLLRGGFGHIDHDIDTEIILHNDLWIGKKVYREAELKENGSLTFNRWNGENFDEVTETSDNITSISGNVNEYASLLIANGFTGDAQSISDIESWMTDKILNASDAELRGVVLMLFKTTGRAVTALTYGWKL